MSEYVERLGGRKFALILILILLFLGFGVFCVCMKVPLTGATGYIAAVGATAYGYFRENVRQKLNGGT